MTRITSMGYKKKFLPASGWAVTDEKAQEGKERGQEHEASSEPAEVLPSTGGGKRKREGKANVDVSKAEEGGEEKVADMAPESSHENAPAAAQGDGSKKKKRQRFNKEPKEHVEAVEVKAKASNENGQDACPKKKRAYGAITLEKRRLHRIELRKRAKLRNTVCFVCRNKGHDSATCPEKLSADLPGDVSAAEPSSKPTSTTATSGICYRCGSTSHRVSHCPTPSDPANPLPFASCFVCKTRGHLSSQCPSNERGMYPNGGCCKWCGNVRHLAKDCPEKNGGGKREEPREDVVGEVRPGQGGDDDDVLVRAEEQTRVGGQVKARGGATEGQKAVLDKTVAPFVATARAGQQQRGGGAVGKKKVVKF
ncbi:hypothetical protein M427DRAFT_147995 [Gonapodya prolifera JEL478]|uniref:CCHC-type domain-containing protein n=1 Tax=Gonapodya prolifera (strain JEL478) TaxID=1344416 RepID=A0A139A330_GONPJ|nr:hypothetical protein M427DRAFT_147995 [Gonapodya prolifera JEL478]|eukprot:KXS11171.1 hypothetical protein M427DRAFT_147995 [Gonapodya prolifera JEL478]